MRFHYIQPNFEYVEDIKIYYGNVKTGIVIKETNRDMAIGKAELICKILNNSAHIPEYGFLKI